MFHSSNLSTKKNGPGSERGLIDRKLVEAPPPSPGNFTAGRSKAALLFWFFMVVAFSMCFWYVSIVAICLAEHFALCLAL